MSYNVLQTHIRKQKGTQTQTHAPLCLLVGVSVLIVEISWTHDSCTFIVKKEIDVIFQEYINTPSITS